MRTPKQAQKNAESIVSPSWAEVEAGIDKMLDETTASGRKSTYAAALVPAPLRARVMREYGAHWKVDFVGDCRDGDFFMFTTT